MRLGDVSKRQALNREYFHSRAASCSTVWISSSEFFVLFATEVGPCRIYIHAGLTNGYKMWKSMVRCYMRWQVARMAVECVKLLLHATFQRLLYDKAHSYWVLGCDSCQIGGLSWGCFGGLWKSNKVERRLAAMEGPKWAQKTATWTHGKDTEYERYNLKTPFSKVTISNHNHCNTA